MSSMLRSLSMTPAAIAGVTDRLWGIADIVGSLESRELAKFKQQLRVYVFFSQRGH